MSDLKIKLIQTEDGSSSLYREDLNETYHSFHGAIGESRHVFIQYGLEPLMMRFPDETIQVFEVGMGTGLNVFLTALSALAAERRISMTTLEPIPIGSELAQSLNYGKFHDEQALLHRIHEADWEIDVTLTDFFTFLKSMQKLEEAKVDAERFHIVYFDAFAPSKQPEMWAIENLQKCFDILKSGGYLVTYCAQGQFKRNLKSVGFEVESLPGAMGKKEMVRAVKP